MQSLNCQACSGNHTLTACGTRCGTKPDAVPTGAKLWVPMSSAPRRLNLYVAPTLACTDGQIKAIALVGGMQILRCNLKDDQASSVQRLSFWS